MKTFKVLKETIVLSILIIMLFQSCITIYKSDSITLKEANKANIKTKVFNKNGETQKFKYIDFEDGRYYGIKKVKGKIIKVPLDEETNSIVKIKNKTISTLVNIPLVFIYVVGVSVAGYTHQYW